MYSDHMGQGELSFLIVIKTKLNGLFIGCFAICNTNIKPYGQPYLIKCLSKGMTER